LEHRNGQRGALRGFRWLHLEPAPRIAPFYLKWLQGKIYTYCLHNIASLFTRVDTWKLSCCGTASKFLL
jgi:hypothetical protein